MVMTVTARRRDAGIDRGGRIGADGADLVAEPRAPDEQPDGERGDEREQERQVERRHRPVDAEVRQDLVELRHAAVSAGTRDVSAFIWPGRAAR